MNYYMGDMYPDSVSTGMLTLPPVPMQADIDQYTNEQIKESADSHATIQAVQNNSHSIVQTDGKMMWIALAFLVTLIILLNF